MDIEKKKLLLEDMKVLEGQIRTLSLFLIAIGSGLATLIVYFDKFTNKTMSIIFIVLGSFIASFLLFEIALLWKEISFIRAKVRS